MKRFWNLVQQDTLVMFRNKFHYAIIFLAVFITVMVNYVLPEQVKMTPSELIYDSTPNKFMETVWREHGMTDERIYQSETDLRAALEKNKNSLGIIVHGSETDPKFTIIQQGHEAESSINFLKASLDWSLGQAGTVDWPTVHTVEYLSEVRKPIPFNKNMLPAFMVLEVVMVGFLLIAVMVFQEKAEGSIRAYRITPGGVNHYILAKVFTNVVLSLCYGVPVVMLTMGWQVDYLNLIGLIGLTSMFATFLGLAISVHFRNLSEFIFVAIALMSGMGIPIGSYFFPAFASSIIRAIPSYPLLFGIREVLFPAGKGAYLGNLYLSLAVATVIVYVWSYWACKRRLMEVR